MHTRHSFAIPFILASALGVLGALAGNTININTVANDFDGDGRSDLVVYHPPSGGWFVRQSSNGQQLEGGAILWGWPGAYPAPGDFDGDGKTDIAVFDDVFSEWYIRLSSTRELMTGRSILLGPIYGYATPGDFNGDGKTDAGAWADGYFAIQLTGSTAVQWLAWGESGDFPLPDDYDGDGKADLAVYSVTGAGTTWKILRSSDGQTNIVSLGSINERPVQADYNGDGASDPEIYDYFTAEWRGLKTFSDPAFGWTETVPVPGDYDGDGLADRAVYFAEGGQWYVKLSSNGAMMEGGPISWGWQEAVAAMPFYFIPDYNPMVLGAWRGTLRGNRTLANFEMIFSSQQPGWVSYTGDDGCEYLIDGSSIYGRDGEMYFSLTLYRNVIRGTMTNPPGYAPGTYVVRLVRAP